MHRQPQQPTPLAILSRLVSQDLHSPFTIRSHPSVLLILCSSPSITSIAFVPSFPSRFQTLRSFSPSCFLFGPPLHSLALTVSTRLVQFRIVASFRLHVSCCTTHIHCSH